MNTNNKELENLLETIRNKNIKLESKLKIVKKLESEIDNLRQFLLDKDRIISGLQAEKEQLNYLLRQRDEKDRSLEN